jgi:hypothetical protein
LKDRISELEDKIEIKEKSKEQLNNSRPENRVYKNSITSSKHHT